MNRVVLLALLSLLFVAAVAGRKASETGSVNKLTINGYKFRKDPKYYFDYSVVVTNLHKALAAGDWKKVSNVYKKEHPERTLQVLARGRVIPGIAVGWVGQPTFTLFQTYYNNRTDFIDTRALKAISSKDATAVKIRVVWILHALMWNQIDEGKIYTFETWRNRSTWGAGEFDDTAGLYIGYEDRYSLWTWQTDLVKKTACRNWNADVIKLLVKLRDLRDANEKVQAANPTVWDGDWAAGRQQIIRINIVSVLRAVYKAFKEKKQAAASLYLDIIAPWLGTTKSKAAIQSLRTSFNKKTATDVLVKAKLQDIMAAENITSSLEAFVGTSNISNATTSATNLFCW